MSAPVNVSDMPAFRCHNCKVIVFEAEQPTRCPSCRQLTDFAPRGVVRPPARDGGGRP